MSEFNTLYDHLNWMKGELTAYVRRRLGCPAEEAWALILGALATIFVQRNLRQAEPIRNAEAFLWVVVKRTVDSEHRARCRWKAWHVPLDTAAHGLLSAGPADAPAERLEADETLRIIREALARRVTPKDRAVFELFTEGGYEAVHEAFDMPHGTARSKVCRVRQILRQALAEHMAG